MQAQLGGCPDSQRFDEANVHSPGQLILMDDPAFAPDLALPSLPPFDFDSFNQALEDSQHSLVSSINLSRASSSSQSSFMGIPIPPSDNDTTGQYQLPGRFQLGSSAQKTPSGINPFDDDEQGLLDDLDFEFDADGGMVDVDAEELERRRTGVYPIGTGRLESDSAASGRVRRDHEHARAGRSASEGLDDDGDFIMQMDDDMNILPDAEAFPTHPRVQPHVDQESTIVESSVSAEVPMRRRKAKASAVVSDRDIRLELPRVEISEWQQDYVSNMALAKQKKAMRGVHQNAITNASIFVWVNGIGGIGKIIRSAGNVPHPLDIFRGDKLKQLITGIETLPTVGRKRARSVFDEDDAVGARNVRTRPDLEEPQLPRAVEDDAFMPNFDDDMLPPPDDSTAELGREALSPLADHHSSAMPWNISTSLHSFRLGSSSLPRGPARQSSVLQGRPGSRLTSASPLLGRGRLLSETDADRTHLSPSRGASTSVVEVEEFEAFGPSAAVDTQTAQNSQWLAEALETESFNFLEFVRCSAAEEGIDEVGRENQESQDTDDGNDGEKWVGFETLFPPRESYRIVAAQAFYHVLSLATKNLLSVKQEVGGEVRMLVRD